MIKTGFASEGEFTSSLTQWTTLLREGGYGEQTIPDVVAFHSAISITGISDRDLTSLEEADPNSNDLKENKTGF